MDLANSTVAESPPRLCWPIPKQVFYDCHRCTFEVGRSDRDAYNNHRENDNRSSTFILSLLTAYPNNSLPTMDRSSHQPSSLSLRN